MIGRRDPDLDRHGDTMPARASRWVARGPESDSGWQLEQAPRTRGGMSLNDSDTETVTTVP